MIIVLPAQLIAVELFGGTTREQMERLDYSETLIRSTVLAREGRDIFNPESRRFVRGIRAGRIPIIYEPDVYTWELAMQEHRRQMGQKMLQRQSQLMQRTQPHTQFERVSPSVLPLPGMLPQRPGPRSGSHAYEIISQQPLPNGADYLMNQMSQRARMRSIDPNQAPRGQQIHQRLSQSANYNNIDSRVQQQIAGQENRQRLPIPALQPASHHLPAGRKGDSFNAEY